VLVIGAALGLKYAYDQNWLGRLPAELRLMFLALSAMGLIGAGEYVYRRINPLSAVGLFGAGVALAFLAGYYGHSLGLYERGPAMALMAVATLIGAGVSMRGRLVSIAALSILGGNIAPLVWGATSRD
jgi:uncharacterized membrane protein